MLREREREISIRATQITGGGIKSGGDRWQVTDPSVRWENIKRSIKGRRRGPHGGCLCLGLFQI